MNMWIDMQLQETRIVQLEELQQIYMKGIQQMELNILREGKKETT